MFVRKFLFPPILLTVLGSAALLAQSNPHAPGSSAREFPVTMRQNVVAGRTAAGTKVQAKLTMATLVDGVVVPADATFSGEVVESAEKSATEPSRLAIRMDSVQWKKGSAPVKVYLTAWYYPLTAASDDTSECDTAAGMNSKCLNGNPLSGQTVQGLPTPPTPRVSDKRALMKDIKPVRQDDGTLVLTSTRINIKLDRTTTYVLAAGEIGATESDVHGPKQ